MNSNTNSAMSSVPAHALTSRARHSAPINRSNRRDVAPKPIVNKNTGLDEVIFFIEPDTSNKKQSRRERQLFFLELGIFSMCSLASVYSLRVFANSAKLGEATSHPDSSTARLGRAMFSWRWQSTNLMPLLLLFLFSMQKLAQRLFRISPLLSLTLVLPRTLAIGWLLTQVLRLASLCQVLLMRYNGEWTLQALDSLGICTVCLGILAAIESGYSTFYTWKTLLSVFNWAKSIKQRIPKQIPRTKRSSWDSADDVDTTSTNGVIGVDDDNDDGGKMHVC